MNLLALAYPTIPSTDRQWIQQIRQQHDPQFEMVAPHFTLVFPTMSHSLQQFGAEMRRQAQGQTAIQIELRCAIVVKDVLSMLTHTFLVPDQGFSDLVKLHDKLYAGDLADELRLDIPYIPHITVASSPDATTCKRIADAINSQAITIAGSIRLIDIVQVTNRTVTTLEQVALG